MRYVTHMVEISEVDDPRVDDFRDLSRADRRPDRPGGRGLVIAEGVVVVERLLASPYPVRALFGVRRRIEALAGATAALDVPAYVASADVMAQVVGFHLNRGVLAVADRAPVIPPAELIERSRRLVVLEGIGDHENLGALFRNAAALGVDGVLLGAGCSDPLYRRSVRVSMGHVLRVPFAHLESWPEDLKLLRDNGFRLAALTPRADAKSLRDAALDEGRVAVLLGSEGPGLTEEAITAADLAVRIPMAGGVDSLNVATAGAIAFNAMSGA
ncbi:tRNA G18 (ribose-2'-O)-methylase SpoU [Saccharopolyspora antimicrobica]|uniref:tRNA G18 (Ribose-2'-O)-methylase SpoU n=1 Tax=Saccharopolyspora antimicrobica TaxID=455193 RepID=A0A1I5F820_9PSEU|nr:RNA methyltransferase [Saccharopolyspora antimicrobica]RKT83709.1 tRNA G18 (ribose-2'-O)-methylase SpoU [Saccharopolyspora antimicrobica]SFO19461.1 tRNA G18 (ribose-2'-O)-methylase SpoU [Saccharopolyspora antimicrobica]